MAIIKPFKALRPQAQLAKYVASRPYDVLTSAEAKIEAQGNPNSFLHITKSEIDLPESIDIDVTEMKLHDVLHVSDIVAGSDIEIVSTPAMVGDRFDRNFSMNPAGFTILSGTTSSPG
jgi:uncharacterized protein (DUF1015 family)